jgi:hypothetical protein
MSAIRPYLKAVMPSLLALIAVVVQLIFTGKYDGPELATTVMGLVSSLLTFLVPVSSPLRLPLRRLLLALQAHERRRPPPS